jgi:hypothetical protein
MGCQCAKPSVNEKMNLNTAPPKSLDAIPEANLAEAKIDNIEKVEKTEEKVEDTVRIYFNTIETKRSK